MINIENFEQLIKTCKDKNKTIYEVFLDLEARMLDKSKDEILEMMRVNLQTMYWSIKHGLENKELSASKLSGGAAHKVSKRYSDNSKLPMDRLFGKILSYSLATIEENQRMGKIASCPTAGSCGILPAVVIAYVEKYKLTDEDAINALITAGGIGKLVAHKMALAGAVAGCQAECGVASAMAAGAATQLLGGSIDQIINATALALKNVMGLACDPVAGLVEVPCVKRNGFLAIHAVTASELAFAGIESVIPIDEIVTAMKQVGDLMSPLLKESSDGGLATTETAIKITNELKKAWS